MDWFVDEVIKTENKMNLHLKKHYERQHYKSIKDEQYRNNNLERFCGKEINFNKFGDQCHLTDAYRGPAHQKCEITVTQKQSIFFQLVFHNFSNYDCHLLFKKLVVKKTVKEIDRIPKTTEECVSVTNGCIQFFARYQFL